MQRSAYPAPRKTGCPAESVLSDEVNVCQLHGNRTVQQSARRSTEIFRMVLNFKLVLLDAYRDGDKYLARPGRKQANVSVRMA